MNSTIKDVLSRASVIASSPSTQTTVRGWVRSVRKHRSVAFIDVSDGSTVDPCPVVVTHNLDALPNNGDAVCITGDMTPTASKKPTKHSFELHAKAIDIVGACDQTTYPLQKKNHSHEFLRQIPHLRMRSNASRATVRIRNTVSHTLQELLQQLDFVNIEAPTLTTNDCEGGGETFTLLDPHSRAHATASNTDPLQHQNNFFATPMHLSVSRQLHLEAAASAFPRVYAMGPCFRAERSNTTRHLAEFQMLEAELAFTRSLDDIIQLIEQCVRHTTQHVLDKCADDLAAIPQSISDNAFTRIQPLVRSSYVRLSYTDAIDILTRKFATPNAEYSNIAWGVALSGEHERYLAEVHCDGQAVFVHDYPTECKPFYARQNATDTNAATGATSAAVDLLLPYVGELAGGTLREERLDVLMARLPSPPPAALDWYVDLRRYGCAPHGGFGLGVDRLVQFYTGFSSIRETTPFPRHAGQLIA